MIDKILITGSNGMLGKSLIPMLKKSNKIILTPSSKKLNLLNSLSIENYLKKNKPDQIIHLAGHIGGIL